MTLFSRPAASQPSLEEVRKRARLLVIDDHEVPFLDLFERDGYHIERWIKIENISQLTDSHFDVILLDLHGVGLRESPTLQGLGVLEHIKQRSPTQLVVAYSAQSWSPTFRDFFAMADAVLDKGDEYLKFKETVDSLVLRRYSAGFFISTMNSVLGDAAAQVPRAVPRALSAIRSGSTERLRRYLVKRISDEVTVDRAIGVIGIAITLLS